MTIDLMTVLDLVTLLLLISPKMSSISLLPLQSPNLSPMSRNSPQSHHFYYKVQICHQCPKIVLNLTASTTKSNSVTNVSNLFASSLLLLSTYRKVQICHQCPKIVHKLTTSAIYVDLSSRPAENYSFTD